MLTKEYRLLLPLTPDEYHLAQLYMVAKSSEEETGQEVGEGIEIVKNEPFEGKNGQPGGQYTEKIFHLKSRVPRFIAALLPADSMRLVERSWNSFPHCKTHYSNAWLGDKLHLSVETMHSSDRGEQQNAVNLSKADLAARSVDVINIATDLPNKIVPGEDPTTFVSQKTGRGKLRPGWEKTVDPIMCAYKVVQFRFKVFGVQTKVEQWGQYYGMRLPFLQYHRKLFCWIDEWHGLTIEDIRKMEAETQRITKEKLAASVAKQPATV
ncbi:hypothetical protein BU14_1377s0001 [Porphyra umbilicalis]|uniref:Phosphatidylinositol transfer protein N-terminal domain-containing protein n=1 Tax=Porphyra umbilicalis TaxID=2786 RepID=A0A1X6NLR1_PORUM|nr:hypothetical protein BU14_1377s0001 [Porphyra umbilicalis]|eukprot:OSX69581.1 hypothetical protein BU14_1377s0001 [Porphyra umbilicalis]